MAGTQFYFWQQDPAVSGLNTAVRQTDIKQTVRRVAIPEDTLAISGRYWQARNGCQDGNVRYIGYSEQNKQRFAVVSSQGKEQIYSVGDALAESAQPRVISLDERAVVLRYPDRVAVLCHEQQQKTAVTASLSTAVAPVSVPRPAVARFEFGVIARVSNAQGQVTGYRLQQCLHYCWLMRQFSIQEGDVLTSIQGITVDKLSAKQMRAMLTDKDADISLTLLRNGQSKVVMLPLQKISPLLHLLGKGGEA